MDRGHLEKMIPNPSRLQTRRSFFALIATLGLATLFLGRLYFANARLQTSIFQSQTGTDTANGDAKVQLEAHIMSKCPDARDCLRDLVVPAMAQVSDLVDFKLSFIAKPIESNDGVECKHGPDECLGNMLELCAAHLYPDPKLYLGFTLCLTNRYQDIPQKDLLEFCSSEHGIDFEQLNACVSDTDGKAMGYLKQSAQRSIDAGVLYSCTVRLEEKVWCVRDDGQWKDCQGGHTVNDLVSDIKSLHKRAVTGWFA